MNTFQNSSFANVPIVDGAVLDTLSAADRETLAELLDEYLAELETGTIPDTERLVAEHPHLAEPLRAYLDGLHLLHRFTMRPPKAQPRGAVSDTGGDPASLVERTIGDYRLLREIGRGGMGVVYEAWQISLDRRVALKMLPFASVLDPKQVARFQNEVKAAAQLMHPHIVPVLGVGCERGIHYYSMTYIDGQPLDQAISELRQLAGKKLPPPRTGEPGSVGASSLRPTRAGEPSAAGVSSSPVTNATQGFSTARSVTSRAYVRSVAQLGAQAAAALQHAHEFGIVHRDVKPSNLLIDIRGDLWITDFGLARIQNGVELTATGDVLGTVRYMSPEQAAGKTALVDHRTDVYSLGATLYELLTLRPAFPGSDRQQLLKQIADEEPPPPRRLNSAIPADLETILLTAMHKQRELRYETARDFMEDLQRFLEGRPTLARRPSLLDRGASWVSRHRRGAVVTASVLLFALLVSTVAAVLLSQKQAETNQALGTAQRHLSVAKEVVDRFGAQVSEELADIPGTEKVRAAMLTDSLRFYKELLTYAGDNPHLQLDTATAAFKAASAAQQLGQLEQAAELYEQAREHFQRLANANSTPQATSDLAVCQTKLAGVLVLTGHPDLAKKLLREAVETQRTLVAQHDTSVTRRQLAASCSQLAALYWDYSQTDAEKLLQEALSQFAALTNEPGILPRDQADAAVCWNSLATLFARTERLADSEAAYRNAISIQRPLTIRFPHLLRYRADLASSCNNLGRLLLDQQRGADAQKLLEESQQLLKEICATSPNSCELLGNLGGVYNNLGMAHEQQGRLEAAAVAFATAAEQQETVLGQFPTMIRNREFLEIHRANQVRVLTALGRYDDAQRIATLQEAGPQRPSAAPP